MWDFAFTPDGRSLVAGANDSSIRWWDMTQAVALERLVHKGPRSHVHAVAISPDGETLVAAGAWDNDICHWRISEDLKTPARLGGHSAGILSLAFSPDGRLLASAGYDNTARLWRVADGNCQPDGSYDHPNWVRNVAFSPDGRYLATACHDGQARVWHRQGESLIGPAVLPSRDKVLADVEFTSDGRYLIGGSEEGGVFIWPTPFETSAKPRAFRGHQAMVHVAVPSLAAWSGSVFLTVGHDARAILWDAASGRIVKSWQLPGRLQSARFAPDGRHVAIGRTSGAIYILRLDSQREGMRASDLSTP